MRVGYPLFLALCAAAIAGAMPARAQTGPVVVIPGKAGVPVIIDGVIADGAVVYGDWGLARPGHGEVVIEGPVGIAAPWDERGYYPKTGHRPRVGRYEIDSQKTRPRPTSFRRDWSAASDFRAPVTQYPPFDPPPVILAPRERRR
jgi:hypothetical protein